MSNTPYMSNFELSTTKQTINKMKTNLKISLKSCVFALLAVFASCSDENNFSDDSKTLNETVDNNIQFKELLPGCNPGKDNPDRNVSGPSNPVLPGTVDDTTCFADYEEEEINQDGVERLTGIFKIKANTEHIKNNERQPRIEKSLGRVQGADVGDFQKLEAYVTIKRVGYDKDDSSENKEFSNNHGTYLFQVKGNHDGNDFDPAICLFIAKPKINSRGFQTGYEIFRERLTKRDATRDGSRILEKIGDAPRNKRFKITCKVGYRIRNRKEELFVNANINGSSKTFIVPDPEKTQNYGIRYGAYRCKAGQAEIYWDSVKDSEVDN